LGENRAESELKTREGEKINLFSMENKLGEENKSVFSREKKQVCG